MADSSPGRTYAGAKLKLMLIPMGGVISMDKPKVAELNAATAIDISCAAIKSQTKIGSTDSETIDGMAAVCEDTNAKAWGQSNAEVELAIFRYFQEGANGGKFDPVRDKIFQMLKNKGTEAYVVTRHTNKPYYEPFAEGDEISIYACSFDQPHPVNEAADRTSGYIRTIHKCQVTGFREFINVVA